MNELFRPDNQGIESDPLLKGFGVLSVAPARPSEGEGFRGTSLVRNHENAAGFRKEDKVPERVDPQTAGVDHKTGGRKLMDGRMEKTGLDRGAGRTFNIYGQFVPDVQRKGNDDLGQGDSTPGGQCVNVHGKIRRGEPSGNQVLLDRSSGQGGLRRKGFHEGDKLSDRKMTDSVPEEENGEKDRFVPGLYQAPVLKKGDGNAGRDRPLLKVRDKA